MLHRMLQVVTGTLTGLAVVSVLLWTGVLGPEAPSFDSANALPAYPAPALALPVSGGGAFDLADLRGSEVALVFFGFASCPDVCPLTLATWTRALEALAARGETFQGVFVSVDPARDTPEVVARWMGAFHPSIRALVGTEEETRRVAAEWGVYVGIRVEPVPGEATSPGDPAPPAPADPHAGHAMTESPGDPVGAPAPGAYLVDHSARTFVVDREGRVVRILPPELDAQGLVAALEPYLER